MSQTPFTLEDLRIARPCHAKWDDMTGDERRRYCGSCRLHVYNVAGMTREDAMNLIRAAEGRVCLRLYRRKDGTVLTQDCPVGKADSQRKQITLATAAMVLLGLGVRASISEPPDPDCAISAAVSRSAAWLAMRETLYERPKDRLGHTLGINSWCTCRRYVLGAVFTLPSAPPPPPP